MSYKISGSSAYIILDCKIIQDPRLSLEGKGVYGMIESNAVSLDEIPSKVLKELIEIGYLKEVEE